LRSIKPDPEVVMPLMVKVLEDPDPSVVLAALEALTEGEPNIELLRAALAHEDAGYWALLVIAEMGPKAKEVVPAIIPKLAHAEPEVRMQALVALGEIGPDAKDAAEAVAKALDDEKLACQTAAVYALGSIGVADDAAKQKLVAMLENEDQFLPMVAAWALAKLDPEDEEAQQRAAKMLTAGLTLDNPQLRVAAAKGLVELKLPPEILRPLLEEVVPTMTPEALSDFAQTVAELHPDDIVPKCCELLNNEKLRGGALQVLARLGEGAKEATPQLVEALKTTEDADLRAEIQFTLAKIGPTAEAAIPELIKSLDNENEEVKQSATYALGKVGPPAADAVEKLKGHLGNEDDELRTVSIWALLHICPDNEEIVDLAIPVLIEALKDEVEIVRIEAAAALGQIGPKAEAAVPALKKLVATDPHAHVRQVAAEAITKIQK
jgi:HEAT repeat protein